MARANSRARTGVTYFCHRDAGRTAFCSLLEASGFSAGAAGSTGAGEAAISHAPSSVRNLGSIEFSFPTSPRAPTGLYPVEGPAWRTGKSDMEMRSESMHCPCHRISKAVPRHLRAADLSTRGRKAVLSGVAGETPRHDASPPLAIESKSDDRRSL